MSRRAPMLVAHTFLAMLVLAGIAVAGLAAYAALARFVLHGPVTPATLHRSLTLEVGSTLDAGTRCRARARLAYVCTIYEPQGSSSVAYRVTVDRGRSCWRARILEAKPRSGRLPRRAEGCVHRWQWTLL